MKRVVGALLLVLFLLAAQALSDYLTREPVAGEVAK